MSLQGDIAFVGSLIDAYPHVGRHVTEAVPPDMRVGSPDNDDWIEWRVLPSTLTEADVAAVAERFGLPFPPLFRAYLLARFHLFDQARSARHSQQLILSHTPSVDTLAPLTELMRAWQPLLRAGDLPFAQWGDGWGPACIAPSGCARIGP